MNADGVFEELQIKDKTKFWEYSKVLVVSYNAVQSGRRTTNSSGNFGKPHLFITFAASHRIYRSIHIF